MLKPFLILTVTLFSLTALAHNEDGSTPSKSSYEDGLTFCSLKIENSPKHCLSFSEGVLTDSLTGLEKEYVAVRKEHGDLLEISIPNDQGIMIYTYAIRTDMWRVTLASLGDSADESSAPQYFLDRDYGPCYTLPFVCM